MTEVNNVIFVAVYLQKWYASDTSKVKSKVKENRRILIKTELTCDGDGADGGANLLNSFVNMT